LTHSLVLPDNVCMNSHATQIIEALGDTAEVALMFDITKSSVSVWKRNGIPKARMMYLKVTRAKVLKGVDVYAATAKPLRSAELPEG